MNKIKELRAKIGAFASALERMNDNATPETALSVKVANEVAASLPGCGALMRNRGVYTGLATRGATNLGLAQRKVWICMCVCVRAPRAFIS